MVGRSFVRSPRAIVGMSHRGMPRVFCTVLIYIFIFTDKKMVSELWIDSTLIVVARVTIHSSLSSGSHVRGAVRVIKVPHWFGSRMLTCL